MQTMEVSTPYLRHHEQVVAIADFLLRYSHGEEYSETELQNILPLVSAAGFEATPPALERLFLETHLEFVKIKCVPAFKQLYEVCDMGQLLEEVVKLWGEVVYPHHLADLRILSEDGLDSLRVIFATLFRAFLDTKALQNWLTELGDVRILQELCKVGLNEEANAVLAQLIPQKIEDYIYTTWRSQYTEGVHSLVEIWVRDKLLPGIQEVLALQKGTKSKVPAQQIVDLAMTCLARLRIRELYDIVKSGCSSGLSDLAQALANRPDLRDETVRGFTEQCELRLLNGASDTVEIIQMFLNTVQAFSVLDPQGVLLEKVSEPIRAMLKERPDTSTKLAEGLFGEPNSPLSFLFDELQKQSKPQTNTGVRHAFLTWTPDPIDTPVDFVRKQSQDSVSTLINLYDNKEVFIKQFVHLFGAELLNHPFDRESSIVRLNELFKLLGTRFGASNMQKIAVMLEDVRRSELVNLEIQKAGSSNLTGVSPLILSRLYWPSLPKRSSHQRLPPQFRGLLEEYISRFEELPHYNTVELEWLPNRGRVRVELELADRVLDMVVLPEEAILISVFGGGSDNNGQSTISSSSNASSSSTTNPVVAYSLSELEEQTNLDEPQLLAAIQFWVDQGVIGTQGEKYKVLETSKDVEEQRKGPTQVVTSTQLASTGLGSVSGKQSKDQFEEMHVYWSYIVGMLTNLGALPLDKIHSFLVMFVPNDDPYVKTKQELDSYLMALVDENKLSYEDGKYSLVKKQ